MLALKPNNNNNKSTLNVAISENTKHTKTPKPKKAKRAKRKETQEVQCTATVATATPTAKSPLWLENSSEHDESLWDLEDDDVNDSENFVPVKIASRKESLQTAPSHSKDDEEHCRHDDGAADEMASQDEVLPASEEPNAMCIATHATNTTSSLFDMSVMDGMNVDELFQVDDDDL
jgi:hypothetical protein